MTSSAFDIEDMLKYTRRAWSEGGFALEGLREAIRVPNVSPFFDPGFHTNGLIIKAVNTVKSWIEAQNLPGLTTKVYAEPGIEPLLRVDIPGYKAGCGYVLSYGHIDKMPPLDPAGWGKGLAPYDPVVRDGNVYGRGSNDDLFNPFVVITSMKYLHEKKLPYPRMIMLLETGEESGNNDIFTYLRDLKSEIGEPGFFMILDGAALNYESLWICNSLRGLTEGMLSIEHLQTPCHSGMGTGIVPSTFRIARMLLSRVEDEKTGEILLPEANLDFEHDPEAKKGRENLKVIAPLVGDMICSYMQLRPGAKRLSEDMVKLLEINTMKPGIEIVCQEGIPDSAHSTNVVRTKTALRISLRLPPRIDAKKVAEAMKRTLEKDPPYGAKVSYTPMRSSTGWCQYEYGSKLTKALNEGSLKIFGKESVPYYVGGTVPLAAALHELWPKAEILSTGIIGPDGNAHGFDEHLNLEYTAKFAACFSIIFSVYAN